MFLKKDLKLKPSYKDYFLTIVTIFILSLAETNTSIKKQGNK